MTGSVTARHVSIYLSLSLSLSFFPPRSTRLVLRNLALGSLIPQPGSRMTTSLEHRVKTAARAIFSRSPSIHRLSLHRASKSPASNLAPFRGRRGRDEGGGEKQDFHRVSTCPDDIVRRSISITSIENASRWRIPRFLASLATYARRPLSTFRRDQRL